MQEKTQIKISDILAMLQNGKTRNDIAEHYGINMTEMKEIFKHPQLKGKKTKKPKELSYQLIDDISGEGELENQAVAPCAAHDLETDGEEPHEETDAAQEGHAEEATDESVPSTWAN